MKFTTFSAIAAAVFVLQAAHAQTPAKTVNRDQLRVCMNSESDLAARRQAMDARNKVNNEEAAAIRAEQQELTEERKRIGEDDATKIERFMNRRAKPHNARVKVAQDKAEAFRVDLEALNKALVAHNDQCGGISFMAEDKEAILKEREAAKKP
ncbi:hypothetical protein [Ramlibacter sp. WS9]|uniref:hypothetical protein n=1 Tax=Ramlibacter sp. WS9 TaxID=1882741 RepID=UPI0011430566|nr:hypothetical protein [Ramlibacter sp. WS9]ROZ69416.1 hypothetical protein EEB15_23170 [Ramlibacter sp. WS9]